MSHSLVDLDPPSPSGEAATLGKSDERALVELAEGEPQQDPRQEHLRAQVTAALFGGSEPPPERIARYRIVKRIGAGAMGEVLEGYDETLTRTIAIKVVHHLRRSPQASARMLQEARSLAQLSHPNVVQVYEAGTLGDRSWIAMEYVAGWTLRSWLDERARSTEEILAAFVAAGEGLVAAHEAGLVHRDFKPDNVLVDERGRVKVVDFGLVQLTSKTDPDPSLNGPGQTAGSGETVSPRLTRDGTVLGTPAYMSPEQMLGVAVDARSDQFSWCVAFWEALHGTRPFLGRTLQELHAATARGRLASGRPRTKVSAHVRRVLARGLAHRPDDRFPTMHELLVAMRRSRRTWPLALGIGAAAVGTTAFFGMSEQPVCGPEVDASQAWSGKQARAIRSAFLDTQLPYAPSAADTTIDALETYTADLERARGLVCEDADSKDPALLQAQLGCLRTRVAFLDALVGSLVVAESPAVERAVDAVAGMPRIERCVALLVDDEPVTAESPHFRQQLAEARAALLTGRVARATDLLHGLIERAELEGDSAAEIDGLRDRAEARFELGELEHGRDDLLAAIGRATSAKLDERAALAWVELAMRGGRDLRNMDDTPQWIEQARAWVERTELQSERLRLALAEAHLVVLSDPGRALERFDMLVNEAEATGEADIVVQSRDGRAAANVDLGHYERAGDDYRWLVEWRRSRYGDDHPTTLAAIHGLGVTHHRGGDLDEAMMAYERALAGWSTLYPDGHLESARVLIALANTELARGDLRRARARAREALRLQQRLAPGDVALAEAFTVMGVVQHVDGEFDAAARSHEEALRIYESAFGPENAYTAIARSNLAEALLLLGQWERAAPLLSDALRILEAALSPQHPHLAYPLKGLGIVALLQGRPLDAVARLEHALELSGPDEAERAEITLALRRARLVVNSTDDGDVEVTHVDDELIRTRLDRLEALLERVGVTTTARIAPGPR
ncbi:MAG: tetratricopeptide repeat protein [Myxococcota bacterium]